MYPKASIHYFPCRLLDNLFLFCLSRNQNPKEFQHFRRWKAFISSKEVTLLCWSCNEVVRITMAVAQSAVQLWKCEPGGNYPSAGLLCVGTHQSPGGKNRPEILKFQDGEHGIRLESTFKFCPLHYCETYPALLSSSPSSSSPYPPP